MGVWGDTRSCGYVRTRSGKFVEGGKYFSVRCAKLPCPQQTAPQAGLPILSHAGSERCGSTRCFGAYFIVSGLNPT